MHRDHTPIRVNKDEAAMGTTPHEAITLESPDKFASSDVLDSWRVGHERAIFTTMRGSSTTTHS